MTLPNAHKGVKKIFIAEILQIISLLLAVVGLLTLLGALGFVVETGQTTSAEGIATTGGVITVIALVLPIIALILNLVGLKQASVDEPDRMAKAFTCAIIALVLSVVVGVCEYMDWEAIGFFSALSSLAQMCTIVFTIMGVSEVTQNIARQDVADMGPKILVIAVIAIVASIISEIISGEAGILGIISGETGGGVLLIVSLVLMIVAYFVFLVFLGRATRALAKG